MLNVSLISLNKNTNMQNFVINLLLEMNIPNYKATLKIVNMHGVKLVPFI